MKFSKKKQQEQANAANALIRKLEIDLTIAENRLKNAEGALIDCGETCTGMDDVVNGIYRLGLQLEKVQQRNPVLGDVIGRPVARFVVRY